MTELFTWVNEDGEFPLSDGSYGNPGCDCGQANAVVRVGNEWLCVAAANQRGLRPSDAAWDHLPGWARAYLDPGSVEEDVVYTDSEAMGLIAQIVAEPDGTPEDWNNIVEIVRRTGRLGMWADG